jgi:hypothetical protein
MLEDPGQDLWREPVDGGMDVPDRSNRLQGLNDLLLDVKDLWFGE